MKQKVRFFKKYLDIIISHLFLIIGIAVFCVLLYYNNEIKNFIYDIFKDISDLNNDILTGLIIAFVSAMSSIIFKGINHLLKYIPRLKSKIYKTLLRTYNKNTKGFRHYIIPKFIKLFYSYDRVILDDQQNVTNQILDTLIKQSNSDKNNIFWIIGDAYSGKTSAILNLLVDLITKSKYYELFQSVDGQIEYFDFGRDDSNLEAFYNNYINGKYEKTLLFIDNIHKITQDSGLRTVNNIARNFNAFAIIFILRPPRAFIAQKEIIDIFEKTMYEVGYAPFKLSKISPNQYEKGKDFEKFIEEHELYSYSFNGTILFHFVKIFSKAKVKGKEKIVESIVDFLKGEDGSCLSIFLRYIIVFSIFTGSFNINEIKREIEQEGDSHEIKIFLNELYDIGFIYSYPNENSEYYFFHEDLAKFYFSQTYSKITDMYHSIFLKSYKYYNNSKNYYLSYLYSFLIPDDIENKKLFENIVINANYRTLLDELNFLLENRLELKNYYHKELGILYDRIGELTLALNEYKSYFDKSSGIEKIDAFFKVVQVDHHFYDSNVQLAKEYENSLDLYSRFLAKYWIIHMNMHYGKFEFERMEELLQQMENSIKELIEIHPYDALHLIRRSYFDFFRLYYISGISDYKRLKVLEYAGIKHILTVKLEEYQAYYNKFVYGHYLLYEILFKFGIFDEMISKEEFKAVFQGATNITYDSLNSKKTIIKNALRFYKDAYDYLYKIGDKTYYFVNCRYMEAKMANEEYEEPHAFYLKFKAFANKENVPYYQACAEIYLFKLEFIRLFSEEILISNSDLCFQKQLREAEMHLKEAKFFYKEADNGSINEYTKVMLDLYETLFVFYTQNRNTEFLKERLDDLKYNCITNSYLRELKIIKYIIEYNYLISPGILKNIILYYPIVAQ